MSKYTNSVSGGILDGMNSFLQSLPRINDEDRRKVMEIMTYWNFYLGYHWEDIPTEDRPEITLNYCRRFIDKFTSFEMGKGFNIYVPYENLSLEEVDTTVSSFLKTIWEDNKKDSLLNEIGQMKNITGEAWVRVNYTSPEQLNDPFGEYEKGRINLKVIPTHIIFPKYNSDNKDVLESLTIYYPQKEIFKYPIIRKEVVKNVVYRQTWTKDKVEEENSTGEVITYENDYGFIPFVKFSNLTISGTNKSVSDLEDIIPINTEINLKVSNISEIIEYYSAPTTIIFGADVDSLQKGTNKMWGGLPVDSKVQNLEMSSDLSSSVSYLSILLTAMCSVGSIPVNSLTGQQAISNTSGVALHFANLPIIERTNLKRINTVNSIKELNKMILFFGKQQKIIEQPKDVSNYKFFKTIVEFNETLPKDELIELQKLETELRLGLESKIKALQRLGKENPAKYLEDIEEEKKRHNDLYGEDFEDDYIPPSNKNVKKGGQPPKVNSGFNNGDKDTYNK